jgi:hypothetical protein
MLVITDIIWLLLHVKVKVKLSLEQAVEAHRVVRRRGSQIAVRLSALRAKPSL